VLSRDEEGRPLKNPPILWEIESEPILAGTKLIAEAWDAGGLYQVGSFVGDRWAEWNGRYRDDVRRFVKSDEGMVRGLAAGVSGSRDMYPEPERDPARSINFITAHDGFTLNDLVSYNEKHNEANGEHNRDGHNENHSWNCGVEGPTQDGAVEALRQQQAKNFLTILLISQGTPMFFMGDEVRRTQYGNNNAYCQDNDIGWFKWDDLHHHGDMLHFARGMIRFRHTWGMFREGQFWIDSDGTCLIWHGNQLYQPDWGDASRSLAFELYNTASGEHAHIMINAYWDAINFELPPRRFDGHWHRIVDTSLPSPEDFADPAIPLDNNHKSYTVKGRSIAILLAL
jgi:glycogen operon protein